MISFGVEYDKHKRSMFSRFNIEDQYVVGIDKGTGRGTGHSIGVKKNKYKKGAIYAPYIPIMSTPAVKDD